MFQVLLAIALGLALFNAGFMLISFNTQDKLIYELVGSTNSKNESRGVLHQMYLHLLDESQAMTKKIDHLEDELEEAQAALVSHRRGLHTLNDSIINLLGSLLVVAEQAGVPVEFRLADSSVATPEELAEYLASKMEEDIQSSMTDDIVEAFSKLLADVEAEMEAADDNDTD